MKKGTFFLQLVDFLVCLFATRRKVLILFVKVHPVVNQKCHKGTIENQFILSLWIGCKMKLSLKLKILVFTKKSFVTCEMFPKIKRNFLRLFTVSFSQKDSIKPQQTVLTLRNPIKYLKLYLNFHQVHFKLYNSLNK